MVFGGVPICLLFAVVICRGYCLEGVLWWVFDGVSGCYQEGVLWGVMEGSLSNIVGAGVIKYCRRWGEGHQRVRTSCMWGTADQV